MSETTNPDGTKRYQGWHNYETWSVALIIDNARDLYEQRRRAALTIWSASEDDASSAYADRTIFTRSQAARFALADHLKEWVRDEAEGIVEVGGRDDFVMLVSQLLGAALDEIDWHELADRWLYEEIDENGAGGYEDTDAQRKREQAARA